MRGLLGFFILGWSLAMMTKDCFALRMWGKE
jgi:hypothetical protein